MIHFPLKMDFRKFKVSEMKLSVSLGILKMINMHFNIDFKDSSDIIFKLIKNILKILFILKWNTYYRCTTYQVTSVISDSLWPYGLGFQTPLFMGESWDSPGKNIGVGCHALFQGSSQPEDWTQASCVSSIAGKFFTPEP